MFDLYKKYYIESFHFFKFYMKNPLFKKLTFLKEKSVVKRSC